MNKWTKKWPNKVGQYWFYGWKFGRKGNFSKDKPEFSLVKVHKCSNGTIMEGDGHFWYENEGGEGWFMPAEFPEPPKLD